MAQAGMAGPGPDDRRAVYLVPNPPSGCEVRRVKVGKVVESRPEDEDVGRPVLPVKSPMRVILSQWAGGGGARFGRHRMRHLFEFMTYSRLM